MELTQELRQKIEEFIKEINPDVFVVQMVWQHNKRNIFLLHLDTDEGIKLSECMDISRQLSSFLDEHFAIEIPYELEVSSPGVGKPLLIARQYLKNIGREVEVVLKSGNKESGTLTAYTDVQLTIQTQKKNKETKKKEVLEQTFALQEIKETKVKVNFNKK